MEITNSTSTTRLRVLHSYPFWLPQTQTWMYTLVSRQSEYIDTHVLCEKTLNLDQFPIDHLHSLCDMHKNRYHIEAFFRNVRLLKLLPCTYQSVNEIRPNLLHSHFGNFGWMNKNIASRFKIPHIVSFYGADASLLPTIKPAWLKRYKDLFATSTFVLAEGTNMKKQLVTLGCDEKKILRHTIGVDVNKISFAPRVWDKKTPLKVLIASSFRQKKGIPIALEALQLLRAKIPIEIILIGDASNDLHSIHEKRKILKVLENTGLNSVTKCLGFVPYQKIFEISQSCHLFLHPSRTADNGDNEGGSPVILTEMVASGMPVIGSFHCDIPEVIIHEKTGFLANENDIKDLYNQIENWINAESAWEQILIAGREHVMKNYNLQIQTEKMIDIYNDTCGR